MKRNPDPRKDGEATRTEGKPPHVPPFSDMPGEGLNASEAIAYFRPERRLKLMGPALQKACPGPYPQNYPTLELWVGRLLHTLGAILDPSTFRETGERVFPGNHTRCLEGGYVSKQGSKEMVVVLLVSPTTKPKKGTEPQTATP